MSDKPTVFEAWAEVMAEVQAISKDSRNTQQNFNFRGIDAVVNAVGPALRKHKVIVIPQQITHLSYRDVVVGQKQTPMRECTIQTLWQAIGPAGDSFTFETAGEALDSGDKGTAKAQSVAQRVSLLQALCIPTDDQDPDSQSYERAYDTNGTQTRRNDPREPDAWSTPVETDVEWLEDFKRRLDLCTKPSEVRGLDTEAHVQFGEGKLTGEDAKALKTTIDARLAELQGETVGASA
jgi:hypothetical protein